MLASGLLFGGTQAWAAAPPANTVIGNQATANYLDPNGLTQSATSNIVQTTVQQVGSFNLDGFTSETTTVQNTKTGAAGSIVYAPHVLTNTGNGTDTFAIKVTNPGPNGSGTLANIAVYADANFDGLPDSTTALCSVTPNPGGVCDVPAQSVAGNNGKFGFVVAYALPATVNSSLTPYASATVLATASTTALYTATKAANVDNINTTTAAAFNLTKAIQQPSTGINAPGGGAWPTAAATGKRSLAGCATTWAAGMTSTANCQYTVYTLTYSNTGGAPGRFVMQDVIGTGSTAGLKYVAGSAVWSGASGTAMGDGAGSDPAGVDYAFDAGTNTITFVDNTLPVSTPRSISFVVLVTDTASIGTAGTSNTAMYNPVDAPGVTTTSPGTGVTSVTNTGPFTVLGTYSIALGSASSTAGTALDTTAGTPNGSAAAGADTTLVTGASAGSFVSFSQTVYNTGNDTDTVNITSNNPGTGGVNAFPAGTTFTYYKADGATPLNDSNGDGAVDTGPIVAGGSTTVVVKAQLPSTLAVAAGVNYALTVVGTSSGDTTKSDTTRDILRDVTGVLVDLTNAATPTAGSSDIGTGPSASPTTTFTVTAGATVAIPLYVANNDVNPSPGVNNTYTLAASSTTGFPGTLPSGWTVKFVTGAVASNVCASATAITSVSVNAGNQSAVTACVTPPTSQAPVTASPLYFQVRSTGNASTGSIVVDTKYDAVTVTAAALTYAATLTPDNTGQVASGGTVVYAHTLTNTGSGACGTSYTIDAVLPGASVTAGWTTAVYLDVNKDSLLDANDTLVTGAISASIPVGGTQAILVKVFAPGGAAAGETATATVTVTFAPSGATSCGAPSAKDVSTAITGQIRLVKTQALNAACDTSVPTQSSSQITNAKPGQCIVYQVTATNQGTATVTNLAIHDALPQYTSIAASQPTVTCTSTGITPALTSIANFTSGSGAVSCGSTSNAVSAGGSATLTFQVQIAQ